jgi:hypothetical protein
MKTRRKSPVWALAFLALLCANNLASAYYDPGVQRWINRDPVVELGGRNLYRFVRNSPPSRLDPWGLSPPKAPVGEKLDCVRDCGIAKTRKAAKLAEEAIKETRKLFPGAKGEDDYADAFRHCYWACRLEREIGAECAEKVLENHETANEKMHQQSEKSAEMDRQNDAVGLRLGEEKGDCGDLCKKALFDGTLVRRPDQVE